MVIDPREEILAVLKSNGPSVPNDLKKIIKGDTMIFGAILSELSSRGLVIISNMKKGSSPFYYLPGQEAQLEKAIEYLNPKDQATVTFLKTQKVVMDKSLELFQRVSLRKIKDFAKELNVNTSQGPMLFWRYYLLDEHEALTFLRTKHNKPQAQPIESPANNKTASVVKEKVEPAAQTPVVPKQVEKAKEVVEEKSHPNIRQPVSIPNKEVSKVKPASVNVSKNNILQQQLTTSQGLERTPFYDSVWNFFGENKVDVIEESQIAKDREYEFVVSVPSAIGTVKYYCRARNKKKLNEGDVAPALLKAKQKDLQCLFLTNGEFTKKSLLMINKEYSGIIIKTF